METVDVGGLEPCRCRHESVQSAKLNGQDPYLKDALERLPTQPASRLEELLPHRWQLPVVTH
jgi:IS66 C-terminal element